MIIRIVDPNRGFIIQSCCTPALFTQHDIQVWDKPSTDDVDLLIVASSLVDDSLDKAKLLIVDDKIPIRGDIIRVAIQSFTQKPNNAEPCPNTRAISDTPIPIQTTPTSSEGGQTKSGRIRRVRKSGPGRPRKQPVQPSRTRTRRKGDV